MFSISKDRSVIIRGVAILAMLFHHLFYWEDDVALCTTYLHVGSEPLLCWLAPAFNPVPVYVLLSGYGHYLSDGRTSMKGLVHRVLRLFAVWWVVLAVFIGVAQALEPGRYLGSMRELLANVTAWNTTFYHEAWFLFPYMLLSLTSKALFRVVRRLPVWQTLLLSLLLFIGCARALQIVQPMTFAGQQALLQVLLYGRLVIFFVIGALMCRFAGTGSIAGRLCTPLTRHTWLAWVLLPLAVAAVSVVKTGAVLPFYTPLVVLLLAHAPLAPIVQRVLTVLGRYSMPMWLVHTWFAYYLFKDYVYALRYPVLIFLALTLVSLATSWVIMQVARPLQRAVDRLL